MNESFGHERPEFSDSLYDAANDLNNDDLDRPVKHQRIVPKDVPVISISSAGSLDILRSVVKGMCASLARMLAKYNSAPTCQISLCSVFGKPNPSKLVNPVLQTQFGHTSSVQSLHRVFARMPCPYLDLTCEAVAAISGPSKANNFDVLIICLQYLFVAQGPPLGAIWFEGEFESAYYFVRLQAAQ
jgi:hypothetical protein